MRGTRCSSTSTRSTGSGPAGTWKRTLFDHLERADVVVCLLTRGFVESQWCFAEVVTAQTLGRVVLPVLVETGQQHPLLDVIQYVEWAGDPRAGRARKA
jgi:TIR domain